jgi:glycine cleavage system H lipoate-binding protein
LDPEPLKKAQIMIVIHAAIAVLLLSNFSEADHLRHPKEASHVKKQTRTMLSAKSVKSAKSVAKVVSWDVVVNNADVIPPPELIPKRSLEEVEEKTFSSYNAASVNAAKDVVFRARSTG